MIRGRSPPASGVAHSFNGGLEFDDDIVAATVASERVGSATGSPQLQQGTLGLRLELQHLGMGLVDAATALSQEPVIRRVSLEPPEPGQAGVEQVYERVLVELTWTEARLASCP